MVATPMPHGAAYVAGMSADQPLRVTASRPHPATDVTAGMAASTASMSAACPLGMTADMAPSLSSLSGEPASVPGYMVLIPAPAAETSAGLSDSLAQLSRSAAVASRLLPPLLSLAAAAAHLAGWQDVAFARAAHGQSTALMTAAVTDMTAGRPAASTRGSRGSALAATATTGLRHPDRETAVPMMMALASRRLTAAPSAAATITAIADLRHPRCEAALPLTVLMAMASAVAPHRVHQQLLQGVLQSPIGMLRQQQLKLSDGVLQVLLGLLPLRLSLIRLLSLSLVLQLARPLILLLARPLILVQSSPRRR
jgi:hypothetical protein